MALKDKLAAADSHLKRLASRSHVTPEIEAVRLHQEILQELVGAEEILREAFPPISPKAAKQPGKNSRKVAGAQE